MKFSCPKTVRRLGYGWEEKTKPKRKMMKTIFAVNGWSKRCYSLQTFLFEAMIYVYTCFDIHTCRKSVLPIKSPGENLTHSQSTYTSRLKRVEKHIFIGKLIKHAAMANDDHIKCIHNRHNCVYDNIIMCASFST